MRSLFQTFLAALGAVLLTAGCAAETTVGGAEEEATSPFQEIYDAGLTRYVGKPQVQPTQVTSGLLSRVDVHRYSTDPSLHGPICMRGAEFYVETRDGRGWGAHDLMIFLQGGGVCLNEICAQTSNTTLNLRLMETGDLIGIGGILDGDRYSNNPLKNADLVHVPYCDGSLFSGDVDRVISDGNALNGTNDQAYQRGIVNLTAAFEVAKREYPNPARVILAGTSGGSLGTIAGVALARYYYAGKEIVVVADSGMPILRGQDPSFAVRALTELNAYQYIPRSCANCLANGHATNVLLWALARDRNIRIGLMAHAHDRAIGQFYMQNTPEQYATAWETETDRLIAAYPTRVNRFIGPGERHMYFLDVENASWDITQQVLLYLMGPIIFDGEDVTASELGAWTVGGMRETSINESTGAVVSGYDWLDAYLRGGSRAFNALQIEE